MLIFTDKLTGMKEKIELQGMKFHAYHGVLPQETRVGGEFVVNLSFSMSHLRSLQTDNLADTISYAEVYELVKTEMEVPSQLLEHVAGRISAALKTHFPELSGLRLKISKKSPPLGGEVESASVILEDE